MSVRRKPALCNLCPYAKIGGGFVPDWWPPSSPRLAVFLEAPGADEVLLCEPMVGRAGHFWERALLRPLGLSRDDVIIANTLRCQPPKNLYLIGPVAKKAQQICRQYDYFHGGSGAAHGGGEEGEMQPRGIADWDPNLFVVTYHPAAILRERAFYRLALADFEKAARYTERGWRVCVLCGDKAASVVWPLVAKGGVEAWRGHVFASSLKSLKPASAMGARLLAKAGRR